MEIVKNPLVSIIIPVYNTKPYLERCIQSIVHQTYKNLEILLIDDGSTDGSSGLCDRFEEQYANIHVVHLENSGVSAARNRGLDIAQGGVYIIYR
nr:glycosyltransferase [Veillonella denticariosi]